MARGWADTNPLHNRTDNPQDQAFLAGFAAAQRRIRMLTPNLNDDAAKAALLAAMARGVTVELLVSKGFNQTTQSLPGQGGPNDANVVELYQAMASQGIACQRLDARWYSYDGVSPVDGNGPRASHAKYTSFDDELVVVGTANMDTQSWNNAREVNVVVDDPAITARWDDQVFSPAFDRSPRIAPPCP